MTTLLDREIIIRPGNNCRTAVWKVSDFLRQVKFAVKGLNLSRSEEDLCRMLLSSVTDNISDLDLRNTIVLNAKSMMELGADYALFAGRIFSFQVYAEVIGWSVEQDRLEGFPLLQSLHTSGFSSSVKRGIEIGRYDSRLALFDLEKLALALDLSADSTFEYFGMQTLYDRYLIIDKTDSSKPVRIETFQYFWMRVAMGLYIASVGSPGVEDRVIQLYRLYKSRRFCSSTPTLFNSGTGHPQLSSCFLYNVEDSIESIMQRGVADCSYLSKWAGGLGGSWTSVRSTNSYIRGTNGESQGVIPFLKLHNDMLLATNQGGKRKGSGCAYLETWHDDLMEFLELRRNTGDERRRTHDLHTANWIPDLFMKRLEERANWTFFRSNEVPDLHEVYGKEFERRYVQCEKEAIAGEIFGRTVPALEVWKRMLMVLFETSHPWLTWKDTCNVRSPQDHVGVIHSSNLCTEITLNTSSEEIAVCNLGSVNIAEHLKLDGSIDLDKLKETVRLAVEVLDNVIDVNYYPVESARNANVRHRPIGLGVMGLAEALFIRGVSFESQDAVEFNDRFFEALAYYAYEASSDLALEKGSYPTFPGSKWDRGLMPLDTLDLLEKERGLEIEVPRTHVMDWDALRSKIKRQGMRNSNVLAIAPTATISNIMGTSPCIEPMFENLYVKSNLSGDFIILNRHLARDLDRLGLWDGDMIDSLKNQDGELDSIERIPLELKLKYKTAFGIDHNYVIQAAARRQKWIDQSQSVNLWLPKHKADMKTMSHMYRTAWRCGLKSTYYLRTQGASNIEKSTVQSDRGARGVTKINDSPDLPTMRSCSLVKGDSCEVCQ
jgi:ribonucleoside-diphosphate reductase alpha chain